MFGCEEFKFLFYLIAWIQKLQCFVGGNHNSAELQFPPTMKLQFSWKLGAELRSLTHLICFYFFYFLILLPLPYYCVRDGFNVNITPNITFLLLLLLFLHNFHFILILFYSYLQNNKKKIFLLYSHQISFQ